MKPTQPTPDVDMQDVEASGYYREILGEAEYPIATKRWSRIESLTDEERAAIYDKDWRQYSEWLHRK